ncbi:MAG: glucan biosynthesis protein D [Alphaproteobacteria bacterium]|nr:glucan biosynthesis protein D [Alphaproteobacteria bacterium]MBO6861177.1 glucan biosynthesis protein D [Alphaproteobacteria bacterium]
MTSGFSRRRFLETMAACGLAPSLVSATAQGAVPNGGLTFEEARPFAFDQLIGRAARLAGQPFAPPPKPAPDITESLSYEHHGKIRYPSERALFADGPGQFPATFFHLGMYFQRPVKMFAVSDGMAAELRYRKDYFEMPQDSPAQAMPEDAGFAGFRLHEDRSRDDWKTQDWIAFLGASYFRAIGELGQYGLSARGIAIDTAVDGPEEFPAFTEFYLEPNDGGTVTVYALLDGPSLTGAFRFHLTRNDAVTVDVDQRLYFRKPVKRLGIAPLTSMFWYAEYGDAALNDWRPEVHDSDGLALFTGNGERLWRPLNNPPRTIVSSFLDSDIKGFGLMQRDRNFENFLDGVHYERRPSLWIEPNDDWGKGSVQLVEIPTDDEIHDNIVAFWVPQEKVGKGSELRFGYRMHWTADQPDWPDRLARCVATRMGRGGEPGTQRPEGVKKFVIEFAGGPLADLSPDDPVKVAISTSRGAVSYVFTEKIPGTDRWRAQFDLDPEGQDPVEMRAYLHVGDEPVSETWTYQFIG